MPYDERLAERVRAILAGEPDVTERKMFGGLAFMLRGNMAVGLMSEGLMVRVDPSEHAKLLEQPGVDEFAMTGRPMRGWVVVNHEEQYRTRRQLERWVRRGRDYALSLPAKG